MGPPRERATASTPRRSIDPDHGDRDPKRRRGGEERAKESPPKLDRLEKKEKAKREKERKEKEGKEEKETSSKKEKKRDRDSEGNEGAIKKRREGEEREEKGSSGHRNGEDRKKSSSRRFAPFVIFASCQVTFFPPGRCHYLKPCRELEVKLFANT